MARIVKRSKTKIKMTLEDYAQIRRAIGSVTMAVLKERTGLSEAEIMERAKKTGAAARLFFAEIKSIMNGGK